LWLLFSAGGVASALVMPILALLFGVAFPLRWLTPPSYETVASFLHPVVARLALFAVCTLGLLHWAHRFRYTLYDGLQVKHLNGLINSVCYGGAIIGSVLTAYFLLAAP
jgi:fumarate reductase subunit D